MRAMLDRGFTTVRDTGGADWGIREGVAQGYLPGPRLFVAGRPIGQTERAQRLAAADRHGGASCHCRTRWPSRSAIADGVDEVRRAVREQLRQGVDHIKIMVSGGVASPYDPLESLQYTTDEIRAAVEEAAVFKRYVCAHAYAAEAVARAVECGVRVIEHGNLIDASTAKLMADARRLPGADARRLRRDRAARRALGHGRREPREEQDRAWRPGLRSLELAREAGVRMAFGSDLLGQLQPDQSKRVPDPRPGALAARDHPLGDGGRRRAARARRASSASSRRARSRISWSWTAIRSAISACCRARASTCR